MRNLWEPKTPFTRPFQRGFLLACLLFTVFTAGCSRHRGVEAAATSDGVAAASDPNVIAVDHPELFPLVKVVSREEPEVIQANGTVTPDVSRTVHINSLAGGRVAEIKTSLGDEVRAGQVVLVLHSQDLVSAMSDYQKAVADEVLARHSLERTRELYAHGALAQKELQQAEDTEQKAKVDVQTTAEHIRLLGGDLNHLSPILEVKSPITGTVVEQNTSGGEAVKSLDSSPSLFTIADLSRVWVLCDVYENDLAQVHLGDAAEVRLNAYPDQALTGRVSNISRILDPATRTAKVRVDLENRAGLMRPGMFATVRLVSRTRHERWLVPASALLRLHDKYWVFQPEGERRFRRTEVQAGLTTSDGLQEIRGGLVGGQAVVANALQFSSSVEQ